MPTATPTQEAAVDAVHTAVSAISSIGTVEKFHHRFDADWEHVRKGGYVNSTTGAMNLWLIDVPEVDAEEGPATGENYLLYRIRIRYWSQRVAESDWQKEAREKVQEVVNALTLNTSVFAIGGQYPVRGTPMTVRFTGPEERFLADGNGSDHKVYEAIGTLTIEARAWE